MVRTRGLTRVAKSLWILLFGFLVIANLASNCGGGMATTDPPPFQQEDLPLPPFHSIVGDLVDPGDVGYQSEQPVPGQMAAPDIVDEEPEYTVSEDGSFQVIVHTNGPVDGINVWGRSQEGDDRHTWEIDQTAPSDPNLNPSFHVLRIPVGHRPPDSMTVYISYRKGSAHSAFKVLKVKYGNSYGASTFQLDSNPTHLGGQFSKLSGGCAGAADFSGAFTLSQSGNTLTFTDATTGKFSVGFAAGDGDFNFRSDDRGFRLSGSVDAGGKGPFTLWQTDASKCTEVYQGATDLPSMIPYVRVTLGLGVVVVPQGGTGAIEASVLSDGLAAVGVHLTSSGVPATVQATFDHDNLAPNTTATANLSLQVGAGTAPGDYPINVRAEFGWAEDTESFILRVVAPPPPSLAVTVLPPSTTVQQGTTTSHQVTVHIVRTNFTGPVTITPGGADAGITVSPATAVVIPAGQSDAVFDVSAASPSLGDHQNTFFASASANSTTVSAQGTFTVTVLAGGDHYAVTITILTDPQSLDTILPMTTVTDLVVLQETFSNGTKQTTISGSPSPPWVTLKGPAIDASGNFGGSQLTTIHGGRAAISMTGTIVNGMMDFTLTIAYPASAPINTDYHGHGTKQ